MKIRNPIFILLIFLVLAGCKKNGTSGKATVSASVEHHGRAIPFANVYIKYAATEFPGADPASYDATQKADAGGNAQFRELLQGDYYLYSTGYDSLAQEEVTGGVPLTIPRKDRKSEIKVDIPVTE